MTHNRLARLLHLEAKIAPPPIERLVIWKQGTDEVYVQRLRGIPGTRDATDGEYEALCADIKRPRRQARADGASR